MRDGHNGYTASVGVAAGARGRGRGVRAARRAGLAGPRRSSRRARPKASSSTLGALADAGDEVLVPTPTYPLYTAVLAKIGARAVYYRTDPARGWLPDLDDVQAAGDAGDARDRADRSEQPDGRGVSGGDAARAHRSRRAHGRARSSPTRSTATSASTGRRRCSAASLPTRRSSRSRRCRRRIVAPGWRAGWLAVGRSDRLDDVLAAIKKLADGRLCSPGPMQYGDRGRRSTATASHQREFVRELKLRADLTMSRAGRAFRA